ncbi:glycerol-3-phosphate dehydrogenase [NAD(+)], cytoplasmic-like [Lytechinus pictus]|uniref:glycerol-3-phosphate dehydrogenase [NAD(+)], cytoplasmic-like n=1 Tax=Lytechinus pictus TaxID=7653 RepID=UPI0030B9DEAB
MSTISQARLRYAYASAAQPLNIAWRSVNDDSNTQLTVNHHRNTGGGSAIARIVGKNAKKHPEFEDVVSMWVFEEMVNGKKLTEIINTTHVNEKYLPGHTLPDNVVAIPEVAEAAKGARLLIFVLPHQFVPKVCESLKGKIDPDTIAISLIKMII